ncbi:MAG TPA: hypothetical protein VHT71_20470 [Methylomirabilota bacterium]|jgi:hypothetical protein|nr:hypothetical protein [Methylomirabilota bacterium]
MNGAMIIGPGERLRLFVTAMLVYALCLTPVLFNPMTWTALDAAVSLVETGRWQVTHGDLYYDNDVAMAGSRKVGGPPPGLAFAMVPTYAVWRAVAGVVDTPESFVALHVFATIVIGAAASALAAGEVAALARVLGAGVSGARWAAILFAFGTPAFLFAVRLYKENLAALIVVAAFRLALTAETGRRWALAGLLGGAAGLVAYPSGLIGLGVAAIALARAGRRTLVPVALGGAVALVWLSLYNAWLFGRPWRFAYSSYLNMPGAADVHDVHFRLPSVFVLVNSLVNQREGLLFYSPFLALGIVGLVTAWRGGWRMPVAVTAIFALALWGLSAAWLAQFPMSFTGARYLFPAVPLLAAFAAPVLERVGAPARWTLAIVSIGLTYLIVQAGHIADPAPLLYAAKTFVSGTGLPVLFKETLPAWLGLETLHTTLARPDVSGRDLVRMLATPAGWRLAANQALMLVASLAAFAAVAGVIRRVWTPPAVAPTEALAR